MYRFRLGVAGTGVIVKVGRHIGVTENSLGIVQIPVLRAMVVVVKLPENSLD